MVGGNCTGSSCLAAGSQHSPRWVPALMPPPLTLHTPPNSHTFTGGCDGNEPQRAYYSQLYKFMPQVGSLNQGRGGCSC